MNLLELIESLDERGIKIEVRPSFAMSEAHSPTMADAEAAKPYREELIRLALARAAMEQVLVLEQEWAGYVARRTPDLEARIQRAKNKVLYLLPEDLPWSLVSRLRPDGTEVQACVALERAS